MLRIAAEWLKSIVIIICLVIGINVFIIQPTKVQGSSMEPTLANNDVVFISKLHRTLGFVPDYGDIVVVDSRVERTRNLVDDLREIPLLNLLGVKEAERAIWIKRVIGKAGDVIEYKDHKLYRNGVELDEPYVKEKMQEQSMEKVIVPLNHVFVMGDNRNYSLDSRAIGPVPLDHLLGVKLFSW